MNNYQYLETQPEYLNQHQQANQYQPNNNQYQSTTNSNWSQSPEQVINGNYYYPSNYDCHSGDIWLNQPRNHRNDRLFGPIGGFGLGLGLGLLATPRPWGYGWGYGYGAGWGRPPFKPYPPYPPYPYPY